MPRAKPAGKKQELQLIKLDIGCGPNKKEGFLGLDCIPFKGVDFLWDVRKVPWKCWPADLKNVVDVPVIEDNSVEEVHTSHFVEHLDAVERVSFCNELHRVLVPGGKCTMIVPHWASSRAYGDPTHKWPPVGEMWFMYLSQKWRDENAPHTDIKHWKQGFKCDFDATWGYGMNPVLASRNVEYQQFALNHHREAVFDIHATLTKKATS